MNEFELDFSGLGQDGGATANQASGAQHLLDDLNEPQRDAVLHDEGPLLILAGAGSGKTRVITRRIAYLIQTRGISPYAILAITFTNKAASEMKQRINELVGSVSDRMWVGTFHSMFARILRRHADLLGYNQNFTIADTADSQQMIKQLVRELSLDEKRFDARMVLNQISGAKNALRSPEKYRNMVGDNPIYKHVARVYRQYQERMLQANCMDFDDILINTVKLFTEHKDVLEAYQERFRYIMVDEYQDTNVAQYQIVKLLAAKHKNLTVVGDDDQSIYSFRGADIRNILDFEKDYKNCKTIKLEQNYRSTETILSAANAVISNNKGRKPKRLWTGAQDGEAITFIRANNHFDEARFIAKEILHRRQRHKSMKYVDFAILYRANALSRVLESALREAGIPYRIYGGLRFYDRKEIKDVLAYLRLVASDRDELAFLRAVNNPRRGIGDATIENLQRESALTGEPMLKLCASATKYPSISRAAGKLVGFAQLIFDMRKALSENTLSFQGFIEYVQEKSGLLDAILEDRALGKDNAAERIENLKELLSDALEFSQAAVAEDEAFFNYAENTDAVSDDLGFTLDFEEEGKTTEEVPMPQLSDALQAFLARAALYSEQDLDNSEEDFVRLMTIHSAKGLEFSNVFLVCAENGVFPSSRSLSEEQGLEEERRLAYVAITRAKQKLYITTARSRMLYGQTLANPVSVFVKEIPTKYLEELGGSSRGEQAAYGSGYTNDYAYSQNKNTGNTYGKSKQNSGGPASLGLDAAPSQSGALRNAKGFDPQALDFLKGKKSVAEKSGLKDNGAAFLKAEATRVGMKVVSSRYGLGTILKLEAVAGDAIIEVQFGDTRAKRMLLNAAKLKAAEE